MRFMQWLLILATCSFLTAVADEDFLGCGGFVQVPKNVAIDLTKVEIRLYSKQGNLKYHTDCAPNNGYYFIPIYDKGDYVIKIVAPAGWNFEPTAVALGIDKINDECSAGKDINFVFRGFSITGKVLSRGRTSGPAGVTLELVSPGSPSALQSVTSGADGAFAFQSVSPGQYGVKAHHPAWKFASDELAVTVESDSLTIQHQIEVLGYPVQGSVTSEGEPIQGVIVSLYAHSPDPSSGHCGLAAPSLASPPQNEGWTVICQTVSEANGRFAFPVVAPGHYRIAPLYQGENILFDITPSVIEFDVEHDSLEIAQKFEVQGFRVSGRVLERAGGAGLVGAKVFLNDKQVAVTGDGGLFNLENIKTGVYSLTAQADDLGFNRLSVRISPTTPSLPDIVASSYKVCGQIDIGALPSVISRSQARQVIFIPNNPADGSEPVIASADLSGAFCHLVPSGSYKLEPLALEKEVAAGLKFVPASHQVNVDRTPQSGFSFTQFRASIAGQVSVISGTESNVPVRLTSVSTPSRTGPVDAVASDGGFRFDNLLPGRYQLSVVQDDWCWRSKSFEVEVVDSDVSGSDFEQIGVFFSVSSSHDIDLPYQVNGQPAGELKIRAGASKHCLSSAGHYTLTPRSCHVFDPPSVEWDSDRPSLVQLKSVRHRVGIVVRSEQPVADMQVSALSASGQKTSLVLESLETVSASVHEHRFVFDATSGETVQVEATAESLLFFPPSLALTVGRDCDDRAGTIIAQRGLYVTGLVRPAISDVDVTITGGRLGQPVVVKTDTDGHFSYGPVNLDGVPILDLATTFSLTAEKRGYIIRPAGTAFGDFVAEKLAEIIVTVVDHTTGQPLPGVLIATAGGVGYRLNSQTGPDGKVSLNSLNPGEYFVKPVLKEYKFDPVSKLVQIEDGATVELEIKGERVAFSCYGTVTTLNGEPEVSVAVEAVGTGSQQCSELQEEASTEANGQFRLRGLRPGCEYTVRMRTGNGLNQIIQRTLPASRSFMMGQADVTGLRFAVVKNVNQADVAVTVAVSEPEHLRTIKLNVYREDQPDTVLHSIKLDNSPLVMLPVLPIDGRRYFVQLESTLSRHGFDHQRPAASFTANVSVQHIGLQFAPKRRSVEGTETVAVSVRSVLAIIACAAAAYFHQSLAPLAARLATVASSLLAKPRSGWSGPGNSSGGGSPVFSQQELDLIEMTTAKKKVKPRRAQ